MRSATTPAPRAHQQITPSERLKRETADLHADVEARLRVIERLKTKDSYAELLRYFLCSIEPVEEAVRAAGIEVAIGLDGGPLLREDLRRLGFPEPSSGGGTPFSLSADEPSVLGACYVVEGSTLGGQVIARMAEESLGISESTGGAFFARGRERMLRWPEFKRNLDGRLRTDESVEQAVGSARGVFSRFLSEADLLTEPPR